MTPVSFRTFFQKKPVLVLLSGLLCSLILVFVMKLWKADINFLFVGIGGDAALETMSIKNLIETGTRNLSDRLGGIGGQKLYDYPVSDFLNFTIMRFFSLFTDNAAAVANLFFLATFPLAAMSAMFALLELRISRSASLFCSLLYPFMAYHFLRNQNHLLLSGYYMAPLGILVVLWLLQGENLLTFRRRNPFRRNLADNPKYFLSLIFCLMISSTGVYYAFFTCFFILLVVVKSIVDEKRWNKTTTASVTMLSTLILGGLLNYLPTFLFHMSGGERGSELIRVGEGAEYYSLRLIDLFMPTMGHHIGRIANLVQKFHNSEPMANENITISLGVMGSIGFALLLFVPILKLQNQSMRARLIKNTSLLAYSGFLLATIGGISALICRLLISGIRAYNRIAVFFFFMGLLAVGVIIDTVIYGRSTAGEFSQGGTDRSESAASDTSAIPPRHFLTIRAAFHRHRSKLVIFLIPLLFAALFDQIPVNSVFPYAANKKNDQAILTYFAEVEASVPAGTYVYQLPYVIFPEPDVSYGSGPYAQLAGYLNTEDLRWSYGAMRGTGNDLWAKSVAEMPAEEMLAALAAAGYGGIYIDLLNYPDDTLAALKDQIIALTGSTPVVSEDGQRVFISLQKS